MLKTSIRILLVFLLISQIEAGPVKGDVRETMPTSEFKEHVKVQDILTADPTLVPVKVIVADEKIPTMVVSSVEKVSTIPKLQNTLRTEIVKLDENVPTDVKLENKFPAPVKLTDEVQKDVKLQDKIPADVKLESEVPTASKVDNIGLTDTKVSEMPDRISRNMDDENDDNNKVEIPSKREVAFLHKLNSKCSSKDISSCIMLKMVTYMNKLLKKASIHVTDGLDIMQTSAVVEEVLPGTARAAGDEEDKEDDLSQLSQLVSDKVWSFVKSRSLQWSVLPGADVVLSASPDSEGSLNLGMSIRAAKAIGAVLPAFGGGGILVRSSLVPIARKKNNNMGPLLAAGVMKLGLIGGIAFKALALLVGKALILSKIAFLLAAIIWLKKLFSQERHVTYEVVAHPHHSHSHVSSDSHHPMESHSSGWGRNLELSAQAAHAMAYKAYAPGAK